MNNGHGPGPSELDPEEPWEAEIGALLGGLPMVEPPEGFLAAAMDHRPLRGGRTLVGLAAAVVIVGAAIVGADLVDRTVVKADLDTVVATLEVDDVEGVVNAEASEPNRSAPSQAGDNTDSSITDKLTAVADALTRQLGFPAAGP
ncbi:MAG: hypothetical protein GY773_04830 [Actinomycetia bacterium]|nr:hypothetical protein [Actinomycetes bacterium]